MKLIRLLCHRMTFVILCMLLQLALLGSMLIIFREDFVYFYAFSVVVSAAIVLYIINDRANPAYKIAWIIPILLFPVFGGALYLVFSHSGLSRREKKQMAKSLFRTSTLVIDPDAMDKLQETSATAAAQSRYLQNYAFCPPCRHTETEYLSSGETMFAQIKAAMESAEKYIFLDYFIIEPGIMWNDVLDILKRKAAQGVDCRVIYDDMGCMFTLPPKYYRTLEREGIRCRVFNPFRPVLDSRFNNRSHRKILSVDGRIAFTGGINLADEYINEKERFGHWKDTAVMLRGDAAWYMTANYLCMWDHLDGKRHDFAPFQPALPSEDCLNSPGFVQPYADNPLDDEPVGENVYINLLYKAKRYVYITTPYLVIDNEMMTALCSAAKSGVDVRLITPHIPDKWYVHAVTRHTYPQLVESGVRIFEYTPGFIHAKSFVVDDEYAVIGTINLDYRSLYLHFENAVWMYCTKAVGQMQEDFLKTQTVSQEITQEQCRAVPFYRRLGRSVLSVFSPLL